MVWWWLVAGCSPFGGDRAGADPIGSIPTVRAPIPAPEALGIPGLPPLAAGGLPPIGVGRAQHRLCTGDPAAREALLTMLSEDPTPAVEGGILDRGCQRPEWLRWVRTQLAQDDPLGTLEPLWGAFDGVSDPEIGAFVVARAPDLRALNYVRTHGGPYVPRLSAMTARLLREGEFEGRYALSALAEIDGPEAEAALLALYSRAPASMRDEAALSLWGRSSEEAQRLLRAACRKVPDPRCSRTRTDLLSELAGGLESGADAGWLLDRYPNHRNAILASAARCAAGGGPFARRCALALIQAAPDQAKTALSPAEDPRVADLRAALLADADALAGALRVAGFEDAADKPGVTALSRLDAAGHVLRIGYDEGYTWPPHHDRLLYELVELVGAEGIAFDEVIPSPSAPTVEGRLPRVALFAYDDGWRTRALADPTGGWDVLAVAGLIDAVLDARAEDPGVRIAVDLDRHHLIAGPVAGLRRLADEGWLLFAPLGGEEPEPLPIGEWQVAP